MPLKLSLHGIALEQIAARLESSVIGDRTLTVHTLCALDQPIAGGLTFSNKKSPKAVALQVKKLSGCVNAVLVPKSASDITVPKGIAIIPVLDPLRALIELMPLFFEPAPIPDGISASASVDPSAKLGQRVKIGAFSAIGPDVLIGDDVVIHPHVTIYASARIGSGTILHSGVVIREECELGKFNVIQNGAIIGAAGFGYIPDPQLGLRAVPQIGRVILEDYVEVGANTCIDRATLGTTLIAQGAKLDNLVQVGHNVRIGAHTIVCGQVGIAGSCDIGSRVVIGGDAGLAGHISIRDDVRIAAKSGVTNSIKQPGDYAGFPAVEAHQWRKQLAVLRRLTRKGLPAPKDQELESDE